MLYKVYLYIETLLLLSLYMLIYKPLAYLTKTIKLFHNTADFYSHIGVHFYEYRKAKEKYDEMREEAIKRRNNQQ
jgi:hypothetical protein